MKQKLPFFKRTVARFWSWWCLSVWNKIDVFYQLLVFAAFVVKNKNLVGGSFWRTFLAELNTNFTSMDCHAIEDPSLQITQEDQPSVALGHFMYCGALGLLFMRSTHFLAISPALGPKLQMIRSMVADLRVFFWLMIIFLFSQGIIIKSFENPNEAAPSTAWQLYQLLYEIMFIPYFQIYGELFVEDFTNDGIRQIGSLKEFKLANTSG